MHFLFYFSLLCAELSSSWRNFFELLKLLYVFYSIGCSAWSWKISLWNYLFDKYVFVICFLSSISRTFWNYRAVCIRQICSASGTIPPAERGLDNYSIGDKNTYFNRKKDERDKNDRFRKLQRTKLTKSMISLKYRSSAFQNWLFH